MKKGIVIFYLWRNKFLLILRDDNPEIGFPNTWSPITGGLEENENFTECAIRESREEIKISPKHLKALGVSAKENGFFFGRLTDEEKESIVLGEGQKFDFFEFNQLSEIKLGGVFEKYLKKFPEIFFQMGQGYEPSSENFMLMNF